MRVALLSLLLLLVHQQAFVVGGQRTEEEIEIDREIEAEERKAAEKKNLNKMHDNLERQCGTDETCQFERKHDGSGFKMRFTPNNAEANPDYNKELANKHAAEHSARLELEKMAKDAKKAAELEAEKARLRR